MKSKDSLYSLLVTTGYLKIASNINEGKCRVAIPNHEIAQVFVADIRRKINDALKVGFGDIIDALLDRNCEALKKSIAAFLLESVSYFDTANEGFFHGLTLGFLAVLQKKFHVISNAESGEGRFDIALKPILQPSTPNLQPSTPYPAFIIEVKKAKSEDEDLAALAREAREQIDRKQYDTSFRAEGITDIEKLGLAYFKDKVELIK